VSVKLLHSTNVMNVKTVDVQEAQTHLAELLSEVANGNEIILAKDNEPKARLIPIVSPVKTRVPGLHRGMIWTSDDFDEPLPESFWVGAA
jgi:prevent-host-death family protein